MMLVNTPPQKAARLIELPRRPAPCRHRIRRLSQPVLMPMRPAVASSDSTVSARSPATVAANVRQERAGLSLAKQGTYRLTSEERAAIEESKAQARRGEFATDEEVEAAYRRFRT